MKQVLAKTAVIHLILVAIGFAVYLLIPESVFTASYPSEPDISREALTRNTRGVFIGIVALVAGALTLVGFRNLFEKYEKGRGKIGNPVSDDELDKYVTVFLFVSFLVMIASSAVTYFAAVEHIYPLFELSLIYSVPTAIITGMTIGMGVLHLIFSDSVTNLWDKFWTITVPDPEGKQTSTNADELATADTASTVEAK